MSRIMYDAVTASNIPRDAAIVAGYSDTIVIPQWTQADWDRFPNSVKVSIVKKASSNWGHVLDVEPGDATPQQAPGWVKMRRNSGLATPTIYCSESVWVSVYDQFTAQGVEQPLYWIAHYDGVQNFPTFRGLTAIAKQYLSDAAHGYDKSWVQDYWPGIDGVDMPLDDNDIKKVSQATVSELMSRQVALGPNKDYLAAYSLWAWYVDRNTADTAASVAQLHAKLDVLTQTVEKITNDPNITADNLKAWIDEAMATHKINVTGTLQIGEASTNS